MLLKFTSVTEASATPFNCTAASVEREGKREAGKGVLAPPTIGMIDKYMSCENFSPNIQRCRMTVRAFNDNERESER